MDLQIGHAYKIQEVNFTCVILVDDFSTSQVQSAVFGQCIKITDSYYCVGNLAVSFGDSARITELPASQVREGLKELQYKVTSIININNPSIF